MLYSLYCNWMCMLSVCLCVCAWVHECTSFCTSWGSRGAPGHAACICVCVCLSAPSTAYQEALAVCSWLGEISLAPKGWTYSHGFTLNLVTLWLPCPVPALCHCHSFNHTHTEPCLTLTQYLAQCFPLTLHHDILFIITVLWLHLVTPLGQCYKLLELL